MCLSLFCTLFITHVSVPSVATYLSLGALVIPFMAVNVNCISASFSLLNLVLESVMSQCVFRDLSCRLLSLTDDV